MEKQRKRFLPELTEFHDYSWVIYLIIFAVYYVFDFLVSILLPNPMGLSFITYIPLLLIVLYLFRGLLFRDLKAFAENWKRYIPFVLLGLLVFNNLPIIGIGITHLVTGDIVPPNQQALDSAFSQTPFLGLFMIVIAAPIVEELMYRRALRELVRNRWFYYALSALLFGLTHIWIGFIFPVSFVYSITYIISGFVLAVIYERSNNIWCCIFIHFLNNSLGMIAMLAAQ